MHVVFEFPGTIPALTYGGIERVIWFLGKELVKKGHKVSYMVSAGSTCDFGNVIPVVSNEDIIRKMPNDADIVHFSRTPISDIEKPYIYTFHGNEGDTDDLDLNTVFVSGNHAKRFGSICFIYNGMNWDDYGTPDFVGDRGYFHFLGKAGWRVKNVKGAIKVAQRAKQRLKVLGGTRLNFKMGFRFTIDPRIKFYGMVGGDEKNKLLRNSKGLIFPVRWHEPFGIAITESLYFGCPVFGTPYGSLPELVTSEFGHLSTDSNELAESILNADSYSKKKCHEYARDKFNSRVMAEAYIKKYEQVLNGASLNEKKPRLTHSQTEKFLPWKN